MSDESIEPHITALVRADGTGSVTVDGESNEVTADDIEGVRGAIIARVAEIAAAHDRPVRVATTDLDGIYPLIVHPGGAVDADGPMIPADTLANAMGAPGGHAHAGEQRPGVTDAAADDSTEPAPSGDETEYRSDERIGGDAADGAGESPVPGTSADDAPSDETPSDETSGGETSGDDISGDDISGDDTSSEDAPTDGIDVAFGDLLNDESDDRDDVSTADFDSLLAADADSDDADSDDADSGDAHETNAGRDDAVGGAAEPAETEPAETESAATESAETESDDAVPDEASSDDEPFVIALDAYPVEAEPVTPDADDADDADSLHDTVVRGNAAEGEAQSPVAEARPFVAAVIPPPPFGVDALRPADDVPAAAGDSAEKEFVPAPSRRSTFLSFEGPLDATERGDNGDGAGAVTPPNADDSEHSDQQDLDDSLRAGADENGGLESSLGAFVDPATGTIPGLNGSSDDAALDRPAPGLGALFAAGDTAAAGTSLVPAPSADGADDSGPTLDDFLQSRPSAPDGPAKQGWQGVVRRVTGGLISPKPGKAERAHRHAISRVQRSLRGPRTIVVLNPKGGAHKTTATLLLAATFGIHRGGSTLAWDNNETRGTLGWRAQPSRHSNTAVDLLRDLDKFADVKSARVGYLDSYVRAQGDAQFDVLASDEDAAASSTIDAAAFKSLHHTLSRFYRVLVIDTGNNMRASNWEAAVEAADQLVVVTTVNEETAASAAWLLDGLRQKGHQDKVSKAVTILSSPGDTVQPELTQRLHAHFSALTRVVLEVPYDSGFQSGGPLNVDVLSPQTREAWLQVTAAVADGL